MRLIEEQRKNQREQIETDQRWRDEQARLERAWRATQERLQQEFQKQQVAEAHDAHRFQRWEVGLLALGIFVSAIIGLWAAFIERSGAPPEVNIQPPTVNIQPPNIEVNPEIIITLPTPLPISDTEYSQR